MFYIDPFYIILSLPALIIGIGAQLLVKYYFSKYSKVGNVKSITGIDVVEKIAREEGLNIRFSMSANSDHYNPRKSEITLSEKVARMPSIAAVGIAAHEMGHAMQHKKSSILMSIRNFMVPVVNIGSKIGYLLFLLGLSLQIFGFVTIGIALFSLSTAFTVITLPIDASRKVLVVIKRLNLLESYEVDGVKKVLTAAALTYVAAVVQSLSTLLYYILRAFGGRKRR
jgi:Zn-dependent membrane protease YugP